MVVDVCLPSAFTWAHFAESILHSNTQMFIFVSAWTFFMACELAIHAACDHVCGVLQFYLLFFMLDLVLQSIHGCLAVWNFFSHLPNLFLHGQTVIDEGMQTLNSSLQLIAFLDHIYSHLCTDLLVFIHNLYSFFQALHAHRVKCYVHRIFQVYLFEQGRIIYFQIPLFFLWGYLLNNTVKGSFERFKYVGLIIVGKCQDE